MEGVFSFLAISARCFIFSFLNRWVSLNSFHVMAVILRPNFGGIFLLGAYLPQKSDILPPFSHDTSSFKDTCLFIKS
jgi:hypothetical protein